MAEEGRLLKPDEDFSAKVEAELPSITPLPLPLALERLTALEKQTRQASDALSTKRILISVVQLCAQHGAWEQLNDEILGFSKKHGQLKAAAQGMVAEAWGLLRTVDWVGKGLTKERGELIETLRVVTEGKVNNPIFALRFCGMDLIPRDRYLWKLKEHGSPVSSRKFSKTRSPRKSAKRPKRYASCRLKHLGPCRAGKKRISCWNRCGFVLRPGTG